MGGHATQLFALLHEKDLCSEIRAGSGVVLGVSADTANMAVHALDIRESPRAL